jgi:glutamate mutase epsilon subunit
MDRAETGQYDQIHISNVFAQKASRPPDLADRKYIAPFIKIEDGLKIKNLQLSQIHRREDNTAIPTIVIEKGADIDVLSVSHASQENTTGNIMPFLKNSGKIRALHLDDVHIEGDEIIENTGEIGQIKA